MFIYYYSPTIVLDRGEYRYFETYNISGTKRTYVDICICGITYYYDNLYKASKTINSKQRSMTAQLGDQQIKMSVQK